MSAAHRNGDPDRVDAPGPGYRRIGSLARLGSCERCGLAVNVRDPKAKAQHEEFHAHLRAIWVAAQLAHEHDRALIVLDDTPGSEP